MLARPVLEAARVVFDEVAVEHAAVVAGGSSASSSMRAERLPQGEVAVDADRQVQIGEARCRRRLSPRGGLRVAGTAAARPPGSGLIARILAPFFFAFSSAVSIRGWLVPGFWPLMTIRSASCTSSRWTDALADADGLGQRDRRRLVAHVRAVGQVVGAEGPGEQLIGERRLVGGLAGGVEDRLVGVPSPRSVSPISVERVVPGDRLVVRRRRGGAPSGGRAGPGWPSQ